MPVYSKERRNAVLNKLLPPINRSVAEVAREGGIAEQTLYNWRKILIEKSRSAPGSKRSSEEWSAESKLSVVIETTPLSEAELNQYCREQVLYPEQVKQWKQGCRLSVACDEIEISLRAYRRWTSESDIQKDKRPHALRPTPAKKLSEAERKANCITEAEAEHRRSTPCRRRIRLLGRMRSGLGTLPTCPVGYAEYSSFST